MFKTKQLDLSQTTTDLVGWHEAGRVNTMSYYQDNQYENGYASIQAIARKFQEIVPYAVNAQDKPVKNANIVNVLARPNKDMSGLDFREALAVMTLVHNKVYVRVWHRGTKASESTIEGFSFLEGVSELDFPDGIKYKDFTGNIYDDDEVMVFKSMNPYNLEKGYSTANAARRWATLDDYIAAYQTGFFKNGAVPAGILTIASPTTQEFEDDVRNLQNLHRGAGKNNNLMYVHRPIDTATGQPSSVAQVEWQETSQTNKDLSLDKLFDQVNKKIDSAYGVPASIRGVGENNNYATARTDQQNFMMNTIKPFTNKIWDRFTFELNRITGGLGYTLAFEIAMPQIAEEELTFAEKKQTETETLMSLVDKGFTLESAVSALGLPDEYLLLDKPEEPTVALEKPTEDVAEVDEGDEVEDAPDVDEATKKLDPLSINCKHCGRYLFKATGTVIIEDSPCPKCKATNNFKIINPLGNDVTHEFTFEETEPKDIKMVALSKQLSPEQVALTKDKIANVMRQQMEEQINATDVKTKAVGDANEDKIKLYAKEILSLTMPLITSEGMKQYLLARTIEGIEVEDLTTFALDKKQIERYQKYLEGIVQGYSEDTSEAIRKTLDTSITDNLPISEVKKNLSGIMNTDEWRVQRLALSETNRAGNTGSIYAMEKVAKDSKLTINKIWQSQGSACEYCRALNGKEVGVTEVFVPKDDEITGADGGTMKNTFGHMDVPTAHSNCGCYTTYKVVKD